MLSYDELLKYTNCSNIDCLRQQDMYKIIHFTDYVGSIIHDFAFAPVIDGVELTDSPYNLLMNGMITFSKRALFFQRKYVTHCYR